MRTRFRLRSFPALLAAAALCLFATRAAAITPRTAHTSTLLPTNDILVAGGIDNTGTFLSSTLLVKTSKDNTIVAGPDITVLRASHTATAMGNGCILIAGGRNAGAVLTDARVYDPITNTISASPAGMTGRYNHTATLLNDGRVLLCGGQTDLAGLTVSGTCDIFTPTGVMGTGTCGGSFNAGAVSFLHARTLHTAVLLQDGKVWFAGGWDGAGYVPTTEKYTPAPPAGPGVFSSASPMVQARANHTATMMGDGRILVAGGFDGLDVLANKGILDTLEIYDPVANNTIPGPTLNARLHRHTSTLLANGDVMLFGGLGNITTTYFSPSPVFTDPSIIDAPSGAVVAGAPVPNVPLTATLSQTVAGTINSGQILYSSPTATTAWGKIFFNDPLVVSLAGAQTTCTTPGSIATCGQLNIPALNIPNIGGTAVFTPISASMSGKATGGALAIAAGNLTPAGSNTTFNTTVTMPGLAGAIVTGTISSLAGTYTSPSYSIAITNGSIAVAGVTVGTGDAMSLSPANATNLAGTMTFNTLTSISFPGAAATAGTLNFTPTPLNATNTVATLTGGSQVSFPLVLNLPADLAGAAVSGTISIAFGTIVQASGSLPASDYTVSLTGGSIPFSGTVNGSGQLNVPSATATSLVGTIAVSSGVVNSGANPASALVSANGSAVYTATSLVPTAAASLALTGTLNYSATHINLGKLGLSVAPSTITINEMVFGQAEYYLPGTNAVSYYPTSSGGVVDARPALETFGHTATLLPTNDVVVIGGSDCSGGPSCPNLTADAQALLTFDEAATFNTTSGSLNTIRALHTATLLTDGTILAAGGTNGLNPLSSAEIFNPLTQQYATVAGSMSNPRDLHTATLLTNGRVLIAGGSSTNSVSTGSINSVDIYYPDTQLFIPTTPMASARASHTATMMPDGKVIVVGGYGTGGVITGTAETFDPEHMTWTSLAATSPRTLHTATLLKDGRLMVAGGIDATGVLNSVFAYNPGTGLWSPLMSMPSKLFGHTATLLLDGRVLVAGGNDGNGETNNSLIYDPLANSWTPNNFPLTVARYGHTSTLLPDGAVMISGGQRKAGPIPVPVEIYKVGGSSWTAGNRFQVPRTNHTMTLGLDGKVYAIGGTNGVIGGSGTAFLPGGEAGYFTSVADINGKNQPPSLRQSSFTVTSATPLQPSEVLTLAGSKLLGGTEASGGGSGSANSSFAVPHLILQKNDASDFILDLTTGIFSFSAASPPTNTAMSATLPAAAASMPAGWYSARVGVNGVYSNATFLQVGPAKPVAAPTSLVGATQGISSITWNWSVVAGVDGYNVYFASNNVFIATVAANSFIQTGIAPNTALQIRVAGYTLTGDGPSAVSPLTAVAPVTVIASVSCGAASPSGDSTTSIPWSWTLVPSAQTYNVYNSTTGVILTVTTVANFYDVGLGTNTPRTLSISAVSAGIEGLLSSPTTCYTLAAPPLPPLVSQNLPLMSASTSTVSLNWIANGNPAGTSYQAVLTGYNPSSTFTVTLSTPALSTVFSGLKPSSYFTAQIFGVNGAGALTSPLPVIAVSTYTLPAGVKSLAVSGTTPVSVSISWDTNSNSTMTYYQVLVATSIGFTGTISTAVPFSANYDGSTFTVTSLLTGLQYFISVQAENPLGQVSVVTSTTAVTYNGGVPFGSLAGLIPAAGGSEFSGTVGGLLLSRFVDMRSPGGSFLSDTVVTISTYSLLDLGHVACSNAVTGIGGVGIALSIGDNPALQPIRPLYLTGSYTSAEAGSFTVPTSQLVLARYDPGSGTCVPLPTHFNTTAKTFVAELNHFSLYQLVAIPLATSANTARIFPNPFRTATDGFLMIDQVPPGTRVRIFTLRGERILDAVADGTGRVTWAADNTAGRSVASGLYLVEVESGGTKKLLKLAVIR